MADERTIIITGPFTDAEIGQLVDVLKNIEQRRPDETFLLVIDDQHAHPDARDTLDRFREMNPLRPGYQRILEIEGPIQ